MIFEFQILPTIIPTLQLTSCNSNGTTLDFGNILVYTCKSSCWSLNDKFKEEIVIVQNEP